MNTVVLKFGGSSVADNIRLNIVAENIISLKEQAKNIVVVVSAQGKTTDRLIREAQELSAVPQEREMDMLLSTGEQITAAKLSIELNVNLLNANGNCMQLYVQLVHGQFPPTRLSTHVLEVLKGWIVIK